MKKTINHIYTQKLLTFTNQTKSRRFSCTHLLLMERNSWLSNILNPSEQDNNNTTPPNQTIESEKAESFVSDGFGYRAKSIGDKSVETDHSMTDESIKNVSMEYKHGKYFLRLAMSALDIDHNTFNWSRILRSLDSKYPYVKKDYLPHRDDEGFTWDSLKRPGMRPDIPWVSEKDPIPWSETRLKWKKTVEWSETDLSSTGGETLDRNIDLLPSTSAQEQAGPSNKRKRSFSEIEEWNKRVRRESETSSNPGPSAAKEHTVFTNESALEQFNLYDLFSINSDILIYITYTDIILYSTTLLMLVYLCYSYITNWRYIPTPMRVTIDIFIFTLFIRLLISCFVSDYLITRFDGPEFLEDFLQDNPNVELYGSITYYLVIILISLALVMISKINYAKAKIPILYFKLLLNKIVKKLTVLATIYSKTCLILYLLLLYMFIMPDELWELLIQIIKSFFNC